MAHNHETIKRTISTVTDQRIVLRHPLPLARTISDGSNWNKIRIGIRYSTRRTTTWVSPPPFYLGVSSGKTALPGMSTVDHFLGRSFIGNWTLATNIFTAGTWYAHIKDGVTTNYGNWGAQEQIPVCTSHIGSLLIDIEKGSPNFTVTNYASLGSTNVTISRFIQAMDNPSGTPTGYELQQIVTNVAVDEDTYGYFDTVCCSFLGWYADNAFEISDFDYAIVS